MREVAGVREAAGSGDGRDGQVALGQEGGCPGEPQQLERGHRSDPELLTEDPAELTGGEGGGAGELGETDGSGDA